MSPSKVYRADAFADFKPELSAPGATPERLEYLRKHGFLIIDDFVGSPWIPQLRAAGRRVTKACSPDHVYDILDTSKGYVHRAKADEAWAIRGLIHPAFGEPVFNEFHGSDEMLAFVDSWCGGVNKNRLSLSGMLLWCNPRKDDHAIGWHRDVTWWGTGEAYFSQREIRGEGAEAYSEKTERKIWKQIQQRNERSVTERNGVSMFLALADDESHELIPGSHDRWRTPYEHDVLLPTSAKEEGVPHTPSWDGTSPLPGQLAVRLKTGQALIRLGANIHKGRTVPSRERNTLSIGWSKWNGERFAGTPKVCDARSAWQLDPAVRDAMPHKWMQKAWDRWAETTRLGDTLEDRYAPWDIARIKEGRVVGWRTELEEQAAAAGDKWEKYQTIAAA
jgi:hypothetical protein